MAQSFFESSCQLEMFGVCLGASQDRIETKRACFLLQKSYLCWATSPDPFQLLLHSLSFHTTNCSNQLLLLIFPDFPFTLYSIPVWFGSDNFPENVLTSALAKSEGQDALTPLFLFSSALQQCATKNSSFSFLQISSQPCSLLLLH